uniref:50S ribosomal protein L34 n=1 Tax=Thorea hispida TaxID=202687 RepID=A0A1Z1XAB7_9FLOR|nr:50S ribosomal protein L34 [Thorea hispida]
MNSITKIHLVILFDYFRYIFSYSYGHNFNLDNCNFINKHMLSHLLF